MPWDMGLRWKGQEAKGQEGMKSGCQWLDGSCQKEHEYQCEAWVPDPHSMSGQTPVGRALCEEHAEWFMRNNLRAGLPVYARRMGL